MRNGLEGSVRSEPLTPALALESEDLTWLWMSCRLTEAHGDMKGSGRGASEVLPALTGRQWMTPSPYLQLACSLSTPGWEAGREKQPWWVVQRQRVPCPLQVRHIPSRPPRHLLGEKTNIPVSLSRQLQFPPFLSEKLFDIGAASEHGIWLDPASRSCHLPWITRSQGLPRQTWSVFISQCYFRSHVAIPSDQPRWSCLSTPAVEPCEMGRGCSRLHFLPKGN